MQKIHDLAKRLANNDPRAVHQAKNLSPKFLAVIGALTDTALTEPCLTGLTITSDGYVLGAHEGDIGFNAFIGSASDLERNLIGLTDCLLGDGEDREPEIVGIGRVMHQLRGAAGLLHRASAA